MTDLNQSLSWEITALGTKILMEKLIKNNVKKIIFASSGSVYGIKSEKNVTENLDLEPISTYNKVKMVTERIILSYSNEIKVVILRPATVCGYSPRMRLDLTVNLLTFQALTKKELQFLEEIKKDPMFILMILLMHIFFYKKK